MNFDLHCHSTFSDGTCSPAEIIDLSINQGLAGLSITDHDSVNAYPLTFELANKKGIRVIAGVEFSANYDNTSVHILGYSFDINHPSIKSLCDLHSHRREERNQKIIKKLQSLGFKIEWEELLKFPNATIGRPHIASLLVEKGYVRDLPSAFKAYLGDGRKCFVSGVPVSIEETCRAIHEAQGFAILAHPHLYHSLSKVKKLFQFPFDGIECKYAQMSEEQNAVWIQIAQDKKLLMTGGSDFHGSNKPTIQLGASSVTPDIFEILFERQKKSAY